MYTNVHIEKWTNPILSSHWLFSSSVLQGSYLPRLSLLYIPKYLQFQFSTREISYRCVCIEKWTDPFLHSPWLFSSSVLQGSRDGRAAQLQAVPSNIVCETWWPPPSFVNVYLLSQAKAATATASTFTAEARHCSQQQQCRRAGRLRRPQHSALREGTPSQAPRPLLCTRGRRLPPPHRLLLCTTTLPPNTTPAMVDGGKTNHAHTPLVHNYQMQVTRRVNYVTTVQWSLALLLFLFVPWLQ